MKKTYDVVFTDSKSADYKGGIIAIVCNETNQVVFNTKVL